MATKQYPEMIEAATVDGASRWRAWLRATLHDRDLNDEDAVRLNVDSGVPVFHCSRRARRRWRHQHRRHMAIAV